MATRQLDMFPSTASDGTDPAEQAVGASARGRSKSGERAAALRLAVARSARPEPGHGVPAILFDEPTEPGGGPPSILLDEPPAAAQEECADEVPEVLRHARARNKRGKVRARRLSRKATEPEPETKKGRWAMFNLFQRHREQRVKDYILRLGSEFVNLRWAVRELELEKTLKALDACMWTYLCETADCRRTVPAVHQESRRKPSRAIAARRTPAPPRVPATKADGSLTH